MKYSNICRGKFIKRPNRFVAYVEIDGVKEKVHVKNTGRCKELLIPGAEVYLEDFKDRMGKRNLRYSLIAVKKGETIVNMDSQAPNKVVREALEGGRILLEGMENNEKIKSEYTYGNSRLDFYVEDSRGNKGLIEVKGVTLEEEGVARFPDAPTQRGIKHIEELIKIKSRGYGAAIIFVIQMKGIKRFEPNAERHREFAEILKQAAETGVCIMALDCIVKPDEIITDKAIPVQIAAV